MGNWNQWRHNIIFFSLIFTACFCYSKACYIEGSIPGNSMRGWIKDIDRGIFWQNSTINVEGIDRSSVGGVTDNRQYLNTDIVDSRFQLFTTALFDEYEEHEVSHNMMVSVTFRCTGGTTTREPQTILVHVNDTNNNPPRFMLPPSSDEFVFTIAAPMPPGYEITKCLDLIVRDIDLTTQKIIFEIEDNPYFEIQKDVYRNPSTPKEFKAIIRTKTFIRTFPKVLNLTIRATDNDTTGDDPRSSETTVRFLGNTDFVLPEEPVFSKTFYLADYTDDNRVVLTEPIALQSGHDKLVQFNIRGEKHRSHFELVEDKDNERSIRVIKALEGEDLEETNIHIIVTADRDLTSGASTTVVLRLPEAPKVVPLEFLRAYYQGKIEDNFLRVTDLMLIQGYGDGPVTATVRNEHSSYFSANVQGSTVALSMTPLDENILMENSFINLEIFATNGRSSATTIVTLEIIKDDNVTPIFNKPIYTGSYDPDGLIIGPIVLVQGHDGISTVELYGADKDYFRPRLNGATVTIEIAKSIPPEIYSKERIVVSLEVTKPRTVGATATIIINLPTVVPLEFLRAYYQGKIEDNFLRVTDLMLIQGYGDGPVTATVINEHSSYFSANVQGSTVELSMTPLDENILMENSFINLEIFATNGRSSATTIVTLDIIKDDNVTPIFNKPIYTGSYGPAGLIIGPIVLVQGHDGISTVELYGEDKDYFRPRLNGATVTIEIAKPIPPEIYSKERIVVSLEVTKPRTVGATATIIINLPTVEIQEVPLEFLRAYYQGKIEDNILRVTDLMLIQGYGDGPVTATVINEHSSYFSANVQGSTVALSMTPLDENILMENSFINLEIFATNGRSSATTIVTLEIIKDDNVTPIFNKPIYTGSYDPAGLIIGPIVLVQGHDGISTVELYGEDKDYFRPRLNGATVTIEIAKPIPPEIYSKERIVVSLEVTKPRTVGATATIIINLPTDRHTEDDVSFGRVLYRGVVDLMQVRHEGITITGYDGKTVEIMGLYSSKFEGSVSDGEVKVQVKGSLTLPADITYLALELHAGHARTVLLLKVLDPGVPLEPSVTFSSDSYLLSVDMSQTGLVGRVSATADNGEDVIYSLRTDDAHLQTHLSINNEGELYLSAPANSGVYNFQVLATTVITQATGTASVHLTVQTAKVCDDKGIVVPPLVILERDEESAHSNLVVLDSSQHAGCHFTLTNRWPADQTWLYVNEFGLHTHSIDREHASIAFMALSQVQVELMLHCRSDTDGAIREKRSETTARLGPYDYGSNKWILTDTISYNSRRSLVNLIVNDINDNDPIFVGKEHEPIVVGYPTDELEERILPRSLAELKATDADIGVNAALRYWSSESVLAVAPTTGFVHVRTGARLTHDQTLTVTATDENGQGRSGNILLTVKLLDLNHIAVVIIRDAFLDDETTVLAQLSDAVGYEVKALRSVVISDDIDRDVTRKKRETGTPRASLQLFVYGINEREPVTVDRLATDIRANAAIANVVSTIPLEDHLQDINILNPEIGLLVATIILSVLLFIVIVIVAIWYFLRWRETKNYDEFNDNNSLPSRNASLGELPKPEADKPRLNIEDLKRSEKRLQEMLQAPIEKVTVVQKPKEREAPVEAILDMPITEPSAPIVIQAIDKLKDAEESSEDEFGEVSNPKKSVVTFNENVEKIIHVEDNADDDGDDDSASTSNINASNSRYVHKF